MNNKAQRVQAMLLVQSHVPDGESLVCWLAFSFLSEPANISGFWCCFAGALQRNKGTESVWVTGDKGHQRQSVGRQDIKGNTVRNTECFVLYIFDFSAV